MPTFTAIALDRLLEPGISKSKSVDKTMPSSKNPIPKSKSFSDSKPICTSQLQRRNSATNAESRSTRPPISPALYATPEPTPLPPPDSPSSYTPSPYIINHKRRGPRLLKSASNADVVSHVNKSVVNGENGTKKDSVAKIVDSSTDTAVSKVILGHAEVKSINCVHDNLVEEGSKYDVHDCASRGDNRDVHCTFEMGSGDLESRGSVLRNDLNNGHNLGNTINRDAECGDFFDPKETMSYTSNTDVEDHIGAESSTKRTTPMGEFYDAWEELSSDNEPTAPLRDVDAELCEMRLTLLMEIEKRKQAEEALTSLQDQWQKTKGQLSAVGLTFPECPRTESEDEQMPATNPAEELCQQVYLARFVSESIGRGIVRAEMETEMNAMLEAKNSEISRLWDRLHFYEAVNREMSQRNQEAVELARRNRQLRKRRQRWVWGSIAAAISLGTATLAWTYFPSGKASSPSNSSLASDNKDASS